MVGTPVANRPNVELEGLIGFFVNSLVMRADLSGRAVVSGACKPGEAGGIGRLSAPGLAL